MWFSDGEKINWYDLSLIFLRWYIFHSNRTKLFFYRHLIVIAEKKSIFVGKNRIKTRPDSLTNQRLPGINATKIVFFLVTTK